MSPNKKPENRPLWTTSGSLARTLAIEPRTNAACAAPDCLGNCCHAQAPRLQLSHLLNALRGNRIALVVRAAPIASRPLEVLLDEVLAAPYPICNGSQTQALHSQH